jgi:hypothetical protein
MREYVTITWRDFPHPGHATLSTGGELSYSALLRWAREGDWHTPACWNSTWPRNKDGNEETRVYRKQREPDI